MYLAKQEDNIHPHFTGNDKGLYATMIGGSIDRFGYVQRNNGLYATMIGGSIDPWLYGDIRNLHLRFQQLYPLCRRMSPRPLNV